MMEIPMGEVDRLPWVTCADCTVNCGRRIKEAHYCLEYNGPTVAQDWACVLRPASAGESRRCKK